MRQLLQRLIRRSRQRLARVQVRELNEMPAAYLLGMASLASFVVFGLSLATVPAAVEWFRVANEIDHIQLHGWLLLGLLAVFGITIELFYEFARAHGKALMESALRVTRASPRVRSAAAERLRQRRQRRR